MAPCFYKVSKMLDKDIRERLFDYLDERYDKVRTIEEKIISRSRADVLAVVPGQILGFEIKSDSDTYKRLKTQVKDYEKFCDRCYVVVGESHIHVDEHVPEYWGIIVVTEDNVIVDRDADICPKVKIYHQLDLLWRQELLNVQIKNGLPKLMGTKRKLIYERLVKTSGEDIIKEDLTNELFERDYTIYDIINNKDISDKTDNKPEKKTSTGKRTRRKTKSKSTKKRLNTSEKADKKRAHVTNYVGKRRTKR